MNNLRMARDYADRAAWLLREAENALAATNAAVSVRRSQEALELSVKAALRRLGIEYPREHDVGDALEAVADRLPQTMRSRLDDIKALMAELARIRGPAFYGYEAEGIPASEAFSTQFAAETLQRTKPLVELLANFAAG